MCIPNIERGREGEGEREREKNIERNGEKERRERLRGRERERQGTQESGRERHGGHACKIMLTNSESQVSHLRVVKAWVQYRTRYSK